MTNPEQHAIDEIDELMAQACDENGVPLDDYNNKDRYVKCELCQHDWHGSPNRIGCPGAWASAEAKAAWEASDEYSKSLAGLGVRVVGVLPDHRLAAVYTDAAGHEVRGTVMFTPYEPGSAAVFVPTNDWGWGEYSEHIMTREEYDQRQLNSPMPQGFRDVGYISDTP